jgi:signal transduction histidine kinase
MLHALKPIEKTICKKIILTAFLLFVLFVSPLFYYYEQLLKLTPAARIFLLFFLSASALAILAHRIKKIISRHISKPLDELSKLTDEVASGNYYAHVRVFSDSEVGSLAKNLNFMIEMTSKHTASLEETIASTSSENHKLKAAVEELNLQLAETLNSRRDFDKLVSQDIKTPLNALINYLEAACFSDAELKNKYGAQLIAPAAAVKNACLDFLSAAGLGEGGEEKLIINNAKTSFSPLVDKAFDCYAPVIDIKKLSVKKEISDGLTFVNIDRAKISAVVNNLVSNAVKFSPAGGIITVKACFEGESLLFSISDRGGGLSEEIQEKTFLSDFCVSAPGTFAESGFGTGLKLCKSFIETHGGTFRFETKEGSGSIFYFKIPMGKVNI